MTWKTPKTDWAANDVLGPNDFNRIEGNTLDNHERLNGHLSDGTRHAKTVRFVVGTSTSGWTKKDCDYLCDGINDQVEINNAINALPASGGEIVILDGTYNFTGRITVNKDNVSIRGSGNATVLKRMWDSSSSEGVITLTSVQGCRIENLQIDGNKAIYTSNYNYGIHLVSSNNNIVTGNTCNNSNNGIRLYSCSNNTVTGNTCNNNNNSCGIYLAISSNNTITGNTCNNNNCGIRLDSSSNNNMVIGNTCNNNSIGIHLPSSINNTITGNTCNNSNYGINLYSSSNNIVTGNTCNNNNDGIYLSSSSNNTVTGNTCNNNNNSIHLYLSSNNTITGNTCNNNNSGIRLSSSSNNTITGNTCIRGTGTPGNYSTDQHTIILVGTNNNYNLITSNNCMGKAPVVQGGTGNSVFNNKWDASDDMQNIADDLNRIEGNTLDNHERLNGHDSRISSNENRLNNIENGPLTKILGKQVEWVEYTLFNVLSSFIGPSNPRGLAWDGVHLWNADDATDKIYRFNTSGTVLASFDSPGASPRGLAYDGSTLWHADADSGGKIYKLNTSGTILSSFNSPGASPQGLAWDGSYIWHADSGTDRIYKLNTSGTILFSINIPSPEPRDLAWDGSNLWNADAETDKIYKLNTSGTVLASFDSPGASPQGLTYDGVHLWNADADSKKIYKIAAYSGLILRAKD